MPFLRLEISREQVPPEWASLFRIESPPKLLRIEGSDSSFKLLETLQTDGLAIVGTRYPQPRSLQSVRSLVAHLSRLPHRDQQPRTIVSGFARGIDRAAHESAIEFGLPTVAILGSGLDRPYPSHHPELKRAILESPAGGLLISEVDWNAQAYPSQFLERNRLIAEWTKATWVVEAGIKSGAMNTARWAREADRDCYATPTYPGDPSLAGNELLMDLHHALPVWGLHSFGRTWIELSALGPQRIEERAEISRGPKRKAPHTGAESTRPDSPQEMNKLALSTNAQELYEAICVRDLAAGGCDVASLLDRSLARGQTPGEFYEALEEIIGLELIQESASGLLIKNRGATA